MTQEQKEHEEEIEFAHFVANSDYFFHEGEWRRFIDKSVGASSTPVSMEELEEAFLIYKASK